MIEQISDYINDKECIDYLNTCDIYDYNKLWLLCATYYTDKDTTKMMKYMHLAADEGNIKAIRFLGLHYQKKNMISEMKTYYLIGIEQNDAYSMNNLGCYYDNSNEPNKEYFLKKYYKMAILQNHINSVCNMSVYYYKVKKFDKMKKYVLLALNIDNDCVKINIIVNNYLDHNFDLTNLSFAYKCKKNLSKKNSDILCKLLSCYVNDLNILHSTDINIVKDECCICFEYEYLQPLLKCNHSLCTQCINNITECPICRQTI